MLRLGSSLLRAPLVGAVARRTFVTVVQQAEVCYREFLGKNRVRLDPGLRMALPIFHTIKRVDMRESFVAVPPLYAYTKDNVPVTVNGTLFFKVLDADRACYQIADYCDAITAVGESTFRAVIGHFEFDEIIARRNELNAQLVSIIGDSITEWGVQCLRCEVQSVVPQNREVAAQLERQMEAERRRRENELDTQALIRSAEGAKQKAVLTSEGELQAARNRADAITYAMDSQAAALANQVRKLAEATGSAATATALLLEHKRLEHLSEVAKQPNRVYFMDPVGAFPQAVPLAGLLGDGSKMK